MGAAREQSGRPQLRARVRAAMSAGQTCSTGLAVLGASESAAELVCRADAALNEANAQGRDRTVVAATYGGRHNGEDDEGDNAS
jgi:GGDEF domain-containing protein